MEWHASFAPTMRQTAWTLLLARLGIAGLALFYWMLLLFAAAVVGGLYTDQSVDLRFSGFVMVALFGVASALTGLDWAVARQRIALRVAQHDPDGWDELLRRQRNVWRMVVLALLSAVWFALWLSLGMTIA